MVGKCFCDGNDGDNDNGDGDDGNIRNFEGNYDIHRGHKGSGMF